jgi:hypothetical protein
MDVRIARIFTDGYGFLKLYFALGGFAIGWMYGFHGLARMDTDWLFILKKSVPIRAHP